MLILCTKTDAQVSNVESVSVSSQDTLSEMNTGYGQIYRCTDVPFGCVLTLPYSVSHRLVMPDVHHLGNSGQVRIWKKPSLCLEQILKQQQVCSKHQIHLSDFYSVCVWMRCCFYFVIFQVMHFRSSCLWP